MERLTERFDDGEVFCGKIGAVEDVGVDETIFVGELVNKLAEYEQAEEEGLLTRLPCKVGDVVYAITSPFNLRIDIEDELDVFECVVESISFYRNGMHQIRLYHKGKFIGWLVRFADLGKTVFLTKAEAEQALAKMKGEEE